MNKYLLLSLIACLTIVFPQMDVLSEGHEADEKKQTLSQQVSRYTQEVDTEPVYPLYRKHSTQYYPMRSTRKASLLSATMPGLGQAYSDNYLKATLFLATEIGVFSLASYNIARALHYNNHDRFNTGFYDERTGNFLDKDQVNSRVADHSIRGSLFLIAGIGLHVWNILDASKTAEEYNKRRFSIQMQQTNRGTRALIFTHRF